MSETILLSRRLLTLKQFIESFPLLTLGALQRLIRKRHKNGLADSGALLRMGDRYIIDLDKFIEWIEAAGKR
jgi:hypothetical protein